MKIENNLISVLLPAFNAEKYIKSSIQSILNQKYSNFELIILNDGSLDRTEEIIQSFKDIRIIYIKNKENIGLIKTLNKGLKIAKGKYIARMDADDISLTNRFLKQYSFLENNPSYVICSSAQRSFNDTGTLKHMSYMPFTDSTIRISSIFNSPFVHPGVMFRKDVVLKNNLLYDDKFKYAEDYELWIRLLQYGKGYNFKEVLLNYRDTPNSQTSIGVRDFEDRKRIISSIQIKALVSIGVELNKDELGFMFVLSLSDYINQIDFDKYSIKFIKNFFSEIEAKLYLKFKNQKRVVLFTLGKVYLKILLFNKSRLTIGEKIELMNHKLTIFGIIYLIKERL